VYECVTLPSLCYLFSGSGTQVNDVRSFIDANLRREFEQNRAFFCALADILMTCAKQDIPLRGHGDDGKRRNDSNWRSIIRLTLRHGNTVLAQHLKTARRNATYTSKTVHNELLQAAGYLIRQESCHGC